MITINEKFYKPGELAEKLEVSKPKIYKDIASGKLECVKVGGTIRITQKQLMEYLNGGADNE